jgi:hypothetical protein
VYQHPTVAQALVRARVADLQKKGARRTPHAEDGKPRHRLTDAAARGTGWLLVEAGLRLAVPRRDTSGRVARGPR